MSAPETGDTNFVDLTLDEHFGYTRKTPYHHQVDNTRVKSEDVNTVRENGRRESCWEEIEWHKRHREEPQDMGEDFTDDDNFADELPCFSVDELWNEELASILNEDNDTFASPLDLDSWEKRHSSTQSQYFEMAAPERCQKKSDVKRQTVKSQISDEVKRPLPRRSQFPTGSESNITSNTSLYYGNSQPKANPRRILNPLPPPPPTPGADDFETTSHTGSAKRTYHNYCEENHDATKRITQREKWRSFSPDPLPEVLEKEDWDIFPEFTKPRYQRSSSSSNQEAQKPTNLESNLGSTSLNSFVMQDIIDLEEGSMPVNDSDFSTDRCKQSPIPSSFFCSKSFKSSEKEEEQDAFAGIFNGLL